MTNSLISEIASDLEKNAFLLNMEGENLSLKDISKIAKEVDDCLAKILVVMNKLEVANLGD